MSRNNQMFVAFLVIVAGGFILWDTLNQSGSSEESEPVTLAEALAEIEPQLEIKQAESFEVSQGTQINFTMPSVPEDGEQWIREAICVSRDFVPEGYRLRIVGDNAGGAGLISMIVSNETLVSLDCPFTGDLESIAEEYSEASNWR